MIQTTTHCTAPRCAADPNRHKEQPKLTLSILLNCPARHCVCPPFFVCACLDGHAACDMVVKMTMRVMKTHDILDKDERTVAKAGGMPMNLKVYANSQGG